jgi:hypothetical protein
VSAPSATAAVAVSHNRIDVSWSDNSTNEAGFEVHRAVGGSGTFSLWTSTTSGTTSYSDHGLTSSTGYCYKIRAFRTTGSKTSYSAFSSSACATTAAPPPPAVPTGADAWPGGSTRAVVIWRDNSIDETGFRIERSVDAGSTWATAFTVGPDATFAFDEGRPTEEQVCYRVIAFRDLSGSPASNEDCTTPPAAPTNLRAASINEVWIEIELTWEDNSAVEDGYQIQMLFMDDFGGQWWVIDELPANSTQYITASYIGGPYKVLAMKDGGNSDESNEATPIIP